MVRTLLRLLLLLLLGAGCNGETSGTPDVGAPDGPQTTPDSRAGDGPGPSVDQAVVVDATPVPDGPKMPAHWDVVTGATVERVDHTATRLADGRVLIVGGWDRVNNVTTRHSDVYLYSPKPEPGAVVDGAKLAGPREGHSASLLPNGRVLVVGGHASPGSPLATTAIYDPKTDAWSAGPSLPGGVSSHVAVTLSNGDVLIVGGHDGVKPLAGVSIYQAAQGSWKLLGVTLSEKRAGHTATLLATGKVLIAGGYDSLQQAYLDSLELYDPSGNTLKPLPTKLKSPRSAHSATLLKDGTVLLVGGVCGLSCTITDDELYDPATGTTKAVSHAGDPPVSHAAVQLLGGRVLITGDTAKSGAVKAVAYDPSGGGAWDMLPDMNHGRHQHTATLLADGSVLVVGGKTGSWSPITKELERFYP